MSRARLTTGQNAWHNRRTFAKSKPRSPWPGLSRQLSLLGMRTYAEYLKSEYWRRAKERWRRHYRDRENFGWYCRACHSEQRPLALHHRTYVRLGGEEPKDLVLLCRGCHEEIHRLQATVGLFEATRIVVDGHGARKAVAV